jgi:hypothetical protein
MPKMKKSVYILLFILVGALFFMLYRHGTQKKIWSENTPLSEFMIGKWKGETTIDDGSKIYLAKFQVNFINQNRLEYCSEYPGDYSCSRYTYKLIGDNIFDLESDRSFKRWKISRDGDQLLVCMSTDPMKYCVDFTRDNSFW